MLTAIKEIEQNCTNSGGSNKIDSGLDQSREIYFSFTLLTLSKEKKYYKKSHFPLNESKIYFIVVIRLKLHYNLLFFY